MIEPKAKTMGADGFERTVDLENRLNSIACGLFSTAAGKEFLDYLKSITVNYVLGPGGTDAHLRHLEGQRYIVSIINRRIEIGRKPQPEPEPRRPGARKSAVGGRRKSAGAAS
jgi:methionine synthase II (cobalamin-independent)